MAEDMDPWQADAKNQTFLFSALSELLRMVSAPWNLLIPFATSQGDGL